MNRINEQIEELKVFAEKSKCLNRTIDARIFKEAADTIEALSAKLQATNMQRSLAYYDNNIFTTIIAELDNRISTQCCIMAGINNERQRYGYVKSIEAYQQSKLIVEQNIEEYKEKQSEMDYDSGWIVCEDALPDDGKSVLATDGEYEYLVEYDADLDAAFGDVDNIIAWRYLPEPYKPRQRGN